MFDLKFRGFAVGHSSPGTGRDRWTVMYNLGGDDISDSESCIPQMAILCYGGPRRIRSTAAAITTLLSRLAPEALSNRDAQLDFRLFFSLQLRRRPPGRE